MKEDVIKKILQERIKNNKIYFTNDEINTIKKNFKLIKKIYLLALTDLHDLKKNIILM